MFDFAGMIVIVIVFVPGTPIKVIGIEGPLILFAMMCFFNRFVSCNV